jgi:hypothetical protein
MPGVVGWVIGEGGQRIKHRGRACEEDEDQGMMMMMLAAVRVAGIKVALNTGYQS